MAGKALEIFKNDFQKLKNKRFIEPHKKHNTGIGKTFEDFIGIVD